MIRVGQPRRDRRTGRIRARRTRAAAPPPVRSGPPEPAGRLPRQPAPAPEPRGSRRSPRPSATRSSARRTDGSRRRLRAPVEPGEPPSPAGRPDPRPSAAPGFGSSRANSASSRPTVPIESPEARWTPPDDCSAPARSPPAPAQGSAPGRAPDGSARACTPGAMVSHAPSSPSSSPPTSPSGHGAAGDLAIWRRQVDLARCRGIGHRPGRRPRLGWPVLSELHSVLPHGRRPCRPTRRSANQLSTGRAGSACVRAAPYCEPDRNR